MITQDMKTKKSQTLTVIGAGNMAEALVQGILKAGLFKPAKMRVADPDWRRRQHFKLRYQVSVFHDNALALGQAAIVVLAVKPKQVPLVLAELRSKLSPQSLIISMAAGVRTAALEAALFKGARVVRVMPNAAALVGKGAAAICRGRWATAADLISAQTIFKAVGLVVQVRETLMDAVTALSGSGPAYVFYLVEAMETAARQMGLPTSMARQLTVATVEGSARLLAETGLPPEELRRRVASRGGTTEAALKVLQARQVLKTLVAAMRKAQLRSRELTT